MLLMFDDILFYVRLWPTRSWTVLPSVFLVPSSSLGDVDQRQTRKIFPDAQQQQFFSGGNVLMSYFKNAPSPSPAKGRLALQSFLATEKDGNPEWRLAEPKDKCPWICGLRAGDGLVRLSCIRKTWSDDDTVVPITSTGTSKSSSIQSTTSQSQWFFHSLSWWFSCLVSNDQKANVMCELLPEDYPPEPPNT